MSRILGIDVGTNSLGLTVRDDSISNNPTEQIVFSSVNLFQSGVGNGKSGEFSYAAKRTKARSMRKLYRVRRYRKWSTLRLLIEDENNTYCPLLKDELKKWMTYDKDKGLNREYPISSVAFKRWICLDFNGDGIPDYSSPYELRHELATVQLDFNDVTNRYKLGRALYHIAQRRGFRSSKGETIQLEETELTESELKASEKEFSGELEQFMVENSLPTIGSAFYHINKEGMRIRKEFHAIRKQYKEEIEFIFNFQDGLDVNSNLYKRIVSEKKGEGTIFYKRPLKSQKCNVGKCTFEPSKPRCPQSRPEYEEFVALSFLNSIRFGENCKTELTVEQKKHIYDSLFVRATDFKFEKIRKWIENVIGKSLVYSKDDGQKSTINYKDSTSIPASKVTYRFKELLGPDWQTWTYRPDGSTHTKANDSSSKHQTVYTWDDVWHVCFSADDEEPLKVFAKKSSLNIDLLLKLWNTMPVSYAYLSLKAINNINHFLRRGLLYNDACLLAKLPDIFKDSWNLKTENAIIDSISFIIAENKKERKIVNVANALISDYKSLPFEEKQGFHDTTYKLTKYDYDDIERFAYDAFGPSNMSCMEETERIDILNRIAVYYQNFFADDKRQYIKTRRIEDDIKTFLIDNFDCLNNNLSKLYHHSQIEYYKPAPIRRVKRGDNDVYVKLLDSPTIAALRNPMALRVLYTLRRKINDLLTEGIISDDDTRVVVEVARELNDSNKRWAITEYNKKEEAKNNECKKYIEEMFHVTCNENDWMKVRMLVEQNNCSTGFTDGKLDMYGANYERFMTEMVKRYRLWIEQGGFCIYTGKPITITKLLNCESFDVEHTIPRSLSFDDSMTNKTLCDSYFNRNIKGCKLPSQLSNYGDILKRIQPWVDKVDQLKSCVEFWKSKSKRAQTKDAKDTAIRQVHLWKMEHDYWDKKVAAFKIVDFQSGFRNNQLVDTSIIAKYSMHYLKSVFSRVDVQRGEVTDQFRKILGIQDINIKKSRDYNWHHAVDAMVLTFIPTAGARDKLLKLFYEYMEAEKIGLDSGCIYNSIKNELRKLDLDMDFSNLIENIKATVLATYEVRNNKLTIAKRRKRIGGKIVPIRDNDGNITFEKMEDGSFKIDNYGHRIPVAKEWVKGDSVRGSLHEDTYFGAITQYDNKDVKFVVRRELKFKSSASESGFKDWKELESAIVNKLLVKMMQKQFAEGTSFKEACEQGIYMINKDGVKVNRIRHVRCYASVTKPIKVKRHIFDSKIEYKNYYYAKNGENIAYALYDSDGRRTFKCLSLYNAAKASKKLHVNDINSIFPDSFTDTDKNILYTMLFVVTPGMMVILRKDNEQLNDLTIKEISNRLYRITRVYDPNDGRLQLQHHLETRSDDALRMAFPEYGKKSINGFSDVDYDHPHPRLLLSLKKQNFWIDGVDFTIYNGKVICK